MSASASDAGFIAALEEAKKGASEGGVPIGACLVSADGKILGRGHNMRMQKGSPTIHVSRQSGSVRSFIRPEISSLQQPIAT
jgi:hypothetical protein